jgi:hypothetical protein
VGTIASTEVADNISPKSIDVEIQRQGKELHELLQMFKQASTEPLSSFVLKTPIHKGNASTGTLPTTDFEPQKHKNSRKSPRLQEKGIKSKGKSVIKKAQEIVARKCGILGEDQEMDNLML